jgi:hypothetical protein
MSFLLRVSLPDVPGSLGRVAGAIGQAGGDIAAIEVVEKLANGAAVDDVLLEMGPGVMPDSIVSACNAIDGVEVLWISRYAAAGNLFLDLEVVEELTAHPGEALERVVDLLPVTFRVDWAARVRPDGHLVRSTEAAPAAVAWAELDRPTRLPDLEDTVLCGAPLEGDVIVLGRQGGPEFLDSELARVGHLIGLARTIHRAEAVPEL